MNQSESSTSATRLHNIREEYCQGSLLEDSLAESPYTQFQTWYQQATAAQVSKPNAMHLATYGMDGYPNSRVVLLKEWSTQGLVFFTDYSSHKGQQIQQNPKASLNFFWSELDRQVRVHGLIEKISSAESQSYFASRPADSQRSAIASLQSSVVSSKTELEQKVAAVKNLECPARWGGYILKPVYFEYWQGQPNRLHDRLVYTKSATGWDIKRLSP
jgi:pyridoxamine 5'-phosphate oxidase